MNMNKARAVWLAVGLGLVAAGSAQADSKTTAIFGLYEADASVALKVDGSRAELLGCDVLRTGRIVGQDGDIGLPKPGVFVMLACSESVLGPSGAGSGEGNQITLLDELIDGARRIALFEGGLASAEPQATGAEISGRQYIVKISMNNNTDSVVRQRELTEIGGRVAEREDRYSPEAAIDVSRAVGAQRPDEVLLLYYDSPEAGDRFRSNNPDIMQAISQFNSRHVDSFVYYVGVIEN
jgi:hypothetical protein